MQARCSDEQFTVFDDCPGVLWAWCCFPWSAGRSCWSSRRNTCARKPRTNSSAKPSGARRICSPRPSTPASIRARWRASPAAVSKPCWWKNRRVPRNNWRTPSTVPIAWSATCASRFRRNAARWKTARQSSPVSAAPRRSLACSVPCGDHGSPAKHRRNRFGEP